MSLSEQADRRRTFAIISHPDADLIQLEKSLKDLGLRQTYTFGGVVTGFLPTQVIPEISKLDGIVYIHLKIQRLKRIYLQFNFFNKLTITEQKNNE